MTGVAKALKVATAVVVLLASLGLVTWRQSRALQVLGQLAEIEEQLSLAEAERVELERTIQFLESRVRVVPQAAERLGMHLPTAAEMVILPAEVVR